MLSTPRKTNPYLTDCLFSEQDMCQEIQLIASQPATSTERECLSTITHVLSSGKMLMDTVWVLISVLISEV